MTRLFRTCTILAAAVLPALSAAQSTSAAAAAKAPAKADVIRAAADVMRRARYATLVTIGDSGQPAARIVDPVAPDSSLIVWIGTNPRTRKVTDIERDARVTLMYFDVTANEYVSLVGRAELVRDAASRRRHWKPEWAPFYPQGPADPGFVLLRVRPSRLEIVSPRHKLVNDSLTWRPVTLSLP